MLSFFLSFFLFLSTMVLCLLLTVISTMIARHIVMHYSFYFYLWLITRHQLTTITLKCVWITSSEDWGGGANPSWGLWLSEGTARDSAIHWEYSSCTYSCSWKLCLSWGRISGLTGGQYIRQTSIIWEDRSTMPV